jgi:hypothetical protein
LLLDASPSALASQPQRINTSVIIGYWEHQDVMNYEEGPEGSIRSDSQQFNERWLLSKPQ